MRIWLVFLLAMMLSGCSGGVNSSLVRMQVDLFSPMLRINDDLSVVYPYAVNRRRPSPYGGGIWPFMAQY